MGEEARKREREAERNREIGKTGLEIDKEKRARQRIRERKGG